MLSRFKEDTGIERGHTKEYKMFEKFSGTHCIGLESNLENRCNTQYKVSFLKTYKNFKFSELCFSSLWFVSK